MPNGANVGSALVPRIALRCNKKNGAPEGAPGCLGSKLRQRFRAADFAADLGAAAFLAGAFLVFAAAISLSSKMVVEYRMSATGIP